jgi:hypothetical protein
MLRRVRATVALAVALGACMGEAPSPETVTTTTTNPRPSEPTAAAATSSTVVTETTESPRDCTAMPLEGSLPTTANLAAASVEISRAVYPCADEVVAVTADTLEAGARWSLTNGGVPLVVGSPIGLEALAEIERLGPSVVTVMGPSAGWEGSWQVRTIDPAVTPPLPLPDAGDVVWLVSPDAPGLATVLAPAAVATGVTVMEAATYDPRQQEREVRDRLAAASDVRLAGPFPDATTWQLAVARNGLELPGGGQIIFPGRRFVALYGTPYAAGLGALGEQSPVDSLARLAPLVEEYTTDDGTVMVPTFDLIATVASAGAGEDDNYTTELTVDELRPWVETAAEHGAYVVLDLQPGRTDFLTQARRYEELLRLPHVGLALDPEWRLGSEQVHLRQTGTVTGAEINTVIDWLAGIVREEALPQKLVVVHQFKLSMITGREELRTPSELAVVIQMDGQGPLATKYDTFEAMVAGADDVGWRWGWKNFYDEDPTPATAAQVLAVQPQPVFVSFQ